MAHQIPQSLNYPEENDETMSEEFQSELLTRLKTSSDHAAILRRTAEGQTFTHNVTQSCGKLIQRELPRYDQQTPYPSQIHSDGEDLDTHWRWPYSNTSRSPQSSSLPLYLPSTEYQSYPGGSCSFPTGFKSLRDSRSLSLEQPGTLHSFPPAGPSVHTHHVIPIPGFHCVQYDPVPLQLVHHPHLIPISGYQQPYRLTGSENYSYPEVSKARRISNRPKQTRFCSTQLSHEQRKVFVTYEADNEAHLKEVIRFVALLRNNGFDTHIDVFEQQLFSISKIDCMERYLNEKDYLIIIVISLKYFETVTGAVDCDGRMSNTVYIHKQLQSEFIQNGCKNFRVIPVLFPGAKNSYVPAWLQNTQLYSWPRDRDDIMRRLLRVEKYTPPPVGKLPTIVTMPI